MAKQEILSMLNLLKVLFKNYKSYYLGMQNSWVLIQECGTEIPTKKGSASPSSVLNFL